MSPEWWSEEDTRLDEAAGASSLQNNPRVDEDSSHQSLSSVCVRHRDAAQLCPADAVLDLLFAELLFVELLM